MRPKLRTACPEAGALLERYGSVVSAAYTQDPVSLHSGVMSSAHVVSARRDGELIGLARVVSDFGSIVYLQNVLVHPDLHRRGVGRKLVSLALRPFAEVRQKVLLTVADQGQKEFYASLGFSEASASGHPALRAFAKF